ncbi:MAG: hypothetical protein Q9170_006526 [Blastenia crenularia]
MHLEPWQSWAIVGLGAAGAYAYYSRTGIKRRGRGQPPSAFNLAKRRTSPRRGSSADAGSGSSGARRKSQSKKGGDLVEANAVEASSSSIRQTSNGKLKKRKGGKKEPHQVAQSSAVDVTQTVGDQEDDVDDREFAKHMSGLKTGSSLAKAGGANRQSRKAGKQAELPLNSFDAVSPHANGTSGSKDLSNASSTTGADADDDLSPAASPTFGVTPVATSGAVDDMLEAPSKGPSVFRLTSVEETKRQAKSQKAVQEPETKKQRQNRKKNEEKKLAKEEAERERRVLLEKQLRTAREAEGRPARNGVTPVPTRNAWSKAPAGSAVSRQTPSDAPNGSLLDTFDESPATVANGLSHKLQGSSTATVKPWHSEVPSEEEQMRILSEMEGSGDWNTVAKGGKPRRKPAADTNTKEKERKMSITSASVAETDDHSTSTSDDIIPQNTPSQSQTEDDTPKKGKTRKEDLDPKVWNRSNIHLHPDYDPSYPYALTGHPEDSDWAVV